MFWMSKYEDFDPFPHMYQIVDEVLTWRNQNWRRTNMRDGWVAIRVTWPERAWATATWIDRGRRSRRLIRRKFNNLATASKGPSMNYVHKISHFRDPLSYCQGLGIYFRLPAISIYGLWTNPSSSLDANIIYGRSLATLSSPSGGSDYCLLLPLRWLIDWSGNE